MYVYIYIYLCVYIYIHVYIYVYKYIYMVKMYLRRETRKVDQSEGKQGEDAKEGTSHILALLA